MKDTKTKFLTDVDRLVLKLDDILIKAGGKKEDAINYKNIQNHFTHIKLDINNYFKEVETLFSSYDKIAKSIIPKEIYERKQIEKKLESLFEEIDIKMKQLKQELKICKKKEGKYGDFTQKEKIVKLMDQKYQFLKNKFDGGIVDEIIIEENKSNLDQLEEILKKEENDSINKREITSEEKAKIKEWNEEIIKQNEQLDDIHYFVEGIKNEVNLANENINNIMLNTHNLYKKTEKVTKNVKSKNKKLKDIIGKLRTGDKLCVDIILVLIALGLIAVLYNLIKMRLF